MKRGEGNVSYTVSREDAAVVLQRLRQLGPFRVLYEGPLAALEWATATVDDTTVVTFDLPSDDATRFMEWLERERARESISDGDTRTAMALTRVASSAGH